MALVSATFAMVNWADGMLQVPGLRSSEKKLGQLKGIFRDQQAWQKLDPETASLSGLVVGTGSARDRRRTVVGNDRDSSPAVSATNTT